MFLFQSHTTARLLSASESATKTFVEMVNSFWGNLPYIIVGVVVFVLFFLIAKGVQRTVYYGSRKARLDSMLSSLVARIAYFVTLVVGLAVASVVVFPGISPGDLFAGLGVGSVALGFAFKDVLQNLFAGFLILLYRPFHVGDQIKIKEFEGTVQEINVRATKIKTYDGELVVMPNNDLYMNAVLVRTAYPHRRVKFTVGIGYNDSIEEARETIMSVLRNTEGVLSDPSPSVDVVELGESAVNMKALFWTNSVQSSVGKASDKVATGIKKALDERGINIPFPHMVLVTGDAASQN